jgi:enolase
VLDSQEKLDKTLSEFYSRLSQEHEIGGTNIIKGVSEAVLFASASCYERLNTYQGISQKILKGEFARSDLPKLMINLLHGGKIAGS